jgi:hypothetical protein
LTGSVSISTFCPAFEPFSLEHAVYTATFSAARCGGGVLEKILQGQWAVGDNEQLNWFGYDSGIDWKNR